MIEIIKRKNQEADTQSAVLTLGTEGIGGVILSDERARGELLALLGGYAESEDYEALLCRKGKKLPVIEAKARIGCVPAHIALYEDMSLRELLDFMGQAKGVSADRRYRRIKEAMTLMRLEKHAHKRMGTLSAYVCRRTLLAAALLGNPDVILCEEPFAGLNAAQSRELSELLGRVAEAKPVVLLSISADILSLCETVAVLTEDRVAYDGPAADFAERLSGTVKLSLTLSGAPSTVMSALSALEGLDVVSSCEEENRLVLRYAAARDLQKTIVSLCESLGCAVRTVERLTPTLADRMEEKGGNAE